MAVDPVSHLPDLLLRWYDAGARVLPWRQPPKTSDKPDPYGVWLAEIMLQQTTVAAAIPYWRRFLARWPDVQALAHADEAEVLHMWAGLGYYARARNLLAAARQVANSGGFPTTEADLRALPGVGPYTAAAIAAIAFGERTIMVDTNVERVGARLFAMADPPPALRPRVRAALLPHVPAGRPGDFGQALMDLGATICTPRAPRCLLCPLAELCRARQAGTPEAFPLKPPRKARPIRFGTAWWIAHGGRVALVRRPRKGLLGGMLGLPGTAWGDQPDPRPPFAGQWRSASAITHVFTHFELRLGLLATTVPASQPPPLLPDLDLLWTPPDQLAGLPTLYVRAATTILESS